MEVNSSGPLYYFSLERTNFYVLFWFIWAMDSKVRVREDGRTFQEIDFPAQDKRAVAVETALTSLFLLSSLPAGGLAVVVTEDLQELLDTHSTGW